MTLNEIERRARELAAEPTYRPGELVYDLQRRETFRVVEARPERWSYLLCDGRWVHARQLEDPLREGYRRQARRDLARLRARAQARSAAQAARFTALLWLSLAALQAVLIGLACWG